MRSAMRKLYGHARRSQAAQADRHIFGCPYAKRYEGLSDKPSSFSDKLRVRVYRNEDLRPVLRSAATSYALAWASRMKCN